MFDTIPALIEHIKTGSLRALAVAGSASSEALPNVPVMSDFVAGFEVSGIAGIGAPKNTPVEIIERLNKEINAGLVDPKIKARLAELGFTTFLISPADYARSVMEETEKWGKVVKFAGIKPE